VRGPGRRVLLADDEVMLLNATQRLLRGQGFEVEAFSDSAEALATLTTRGAAYYDLAILDVNMPGPSGVDIVRYISEHLPLLPVLVVSGFLTDDIAHQLYTLGAGKVLQKPWLSKDLLRAVGALLRAA
jgi:DNA-binding response OmpR family regulator